MSEPGVDCVLNQRTTASQCTSSQTHLGFQCVRECANGQQCTIHLAGKRLRHTAPIGCLGCSAQRNTQHRQHRQQLMIWTLLMCTALRQHTMP